MLEILKILKIHQKLLCFRILIKDLSRRIECDKRPLISCQKYLLIGLVAHKCFGITKTEDKKRIALGTVVASAAGMAFNVVADPLVGYFYKMWILGVPQEFAKAWAKIGAVTTLVNAVVAVIAASVFYGALRPALRKANLFPKVR